jgi:hypothetical protein
VTGSLFADRHRDPIIQVACCRSCGQDREGETRFESMAFGNTPPGRAIHFCFECEAAIIERPLDEVLMEYLTGER